MQYGLCLSDSKAPCSFIKAFRRIGGTDLLIELPELLKKRRILARSVHEAVHAYVCFR